MIRSKPAKGRQRDETVRTDYDETTKFVTNAGETRFAMVAANTILQNQMAGIHADTDPVPTQMGTRNATVSKDGTVFLAHGGQTKLNALVVVSPQKK